MKPNRQKIGAPELDSRLCGGLFAGRLTVIAGPAGVGTRNLGVSFCGKQRGIILDFSPDPDLFDYADVAMRQHGWKPRRFCPPEPFNPDFIWKRQGVRSDLFHIYQCLDEADRPKRVPTEDQYAGLCDKVTGRRNRIAAFLYANFIRGVNRLVIDGIESTASPFGQAQASLLDGILTDMVHVPPVDLARWVFGKKSGDHSGEIGARQYSPRKIGVVVVMRTQAEYKASWPNKREWKWESGIPKETPPGKILSGAGYSPKWRPADWETTIHCGRIRDREDYVLTIPAHNLSSHNPGPLGYVVDDKTARLRFY